MACLLTGLTLNRNPRIGVLRKYGSTLAERAQESGKMDEINAAIHFGVQALSLSLREGHAIRAAAATPENYLTIDIIHDIGLFLVGRYRISHDDVDLINSVEWQLHALNHLPDEYCVREPEAVLNFSLTLDEHFKRFDDVESLRATMSIRRRLIDLMPNGARDMKAQLLDSLGFHFMTIVNRCQGDRSALASAIEAFQCSAVNTLDRDPVKPLRLKLVAVALLMVGSLDSNQYPDATVEAAQRAIHALPRDADHAEQAELLMMLSKAFLYRFDARHVVQDIQDSITIQRRAVHVAPESSKPRMLLELTSPLMRSQSDDDLDEAVQVCRQLLLDGPGNPRAHLRETRNRSWATQDIDMITAKLRAALSLLDHRNSAPFVIEVMGDLGAALNLRFIRHGHIQDIDEAISVLRQSVGLEDNPHAMSRDSTDDHRRSRRSFGDDFGIAERLRQLGFALKARFQTLRLFQDGQESMDVYRYAIELRPDNASCYWHFADAVVIMLGENSSHENDRLIEGALALSRQAVRLLPDSSVEKPWALFALARMLEYPQSSLPLLPALDEALSVLDHAHHLCSKTSDPFVIVQHFMVRSSIYKRRFLETKSLQDIEAAILDNRTTLEVLPAHYAPLLRGDLENNLSDSLRQRFAYFPSHEHLVQAHDAFLATARTRKKLRLASAVRQASTYIYHHKFDESYEYAMDAFKIVLDSIPLTVWLGRTISDRLVWLQRSHVGFAIKSAAATAIAVGKYGLALAWLEEGRNVIWGQLTQLRDSFADLMRVDAPLAQRLLDVSTRLDKAAQHYERSASSGLLGSWTPDSSHPRVALDSQARAHRELASEHEDLLARVRKLPGFTNFLRTKPFAELAPASRDGPVVVINVNQAHSDALVLCSQGRLVLVPLPGLTDDIAQDWRTELTRSIRHRSTRTTLHDNDRGPYIPPTSERTLLDILFEGVVEPILAAIQHELAPKAEEFLHITWCATGSLASLPLHAAAISKSSMKIVSSYTPSLSALLEAQAQPATTRACVSGPSLLVVSQAKTPGKAPIPKTFTEAGLVHALFPESTTRYDGSQATVETVFDAMKTHDWVHLACHAAQDASTATGSAFALHDGPLELSRLMAARQTRELAVLSACQTAKGDAELPEEAAHLAAGMLAAGYKSVVATLWSIRDEDGPVIAKALYAALKRNLNAPGGLRVAFALHEATMELRDKIREETERIVDDEVRERVKEQEFERWAPFVHFGV